jgi:hypothetical protein
MHGVSTQGLSGVRQNIPTIQRAPSLPLVQIQESLLMRKTKAEAFIRLHNLPPASQT